MPLVARTQGSHESSTVVLPESGAAVRLGGDDRYLVVRPQQGIGALEVDRAALLAFADQLVATLAAEHHLRPVRQACRPGVARRSGGERLRGRHLPGVRRIVAATPDAAVRRTCNDTATVCSPFVSTGSFRRSVKPVSHPLLDPASGSSGVQ